MFRLLERRGRLRTGLSILHFAPEIGMSIRLRELASHYVAADLNVTPYAKSIPDIQQVDLCVDDLARFAGAFDLVIHSHVLEHLPCDVGQVLQRMSRCLRAGAEMYFATPIRSNARTTQDLAPDLQAGERKRRFGQHDHVRMFGDLDVMDLLTAALGTTVRPVDPKEYLSAAELKMIAVPDGPRLSGNTIFVVSAALGGN